MTASLTLPTGTVAFLLTDIEGSTPLWESEPDAMHAAVDCHDQILDAAVSAHGGVRPPAQGEGDSIVAAFSRASDAVSAALDAQKAFAVEEWPTSRPLRVRMAVHSGEARFVDDGNYAGQAIIRTARLRAIAHGGQALVSAPARDLTVDQLGDKVTFVDLGEHRLRDLARPERVYQLTDPAIPADFPALQSLNARPHNLPIQLSSFIGRTDEIATVVALVRANRLVTVTGSGGAGKTRLALQVAAELVEDWPDGVWWVELAELTDPAGIAMAIGSALQVSAGVGHDAVDGLTAMVGDRRLLLALDNCEHLVADVARVVDRLLRGCPGVSVLATTREPLEIGGEVAWRIPPLAVPERTSPANPVVALGQSDSVQLFLDRAQHVRPNFHLDVSTAPVIAEICARLDGIPLAIELAAARVRSLTPTQILDGLADAFRLLTGADRVALPRQKTLEASITWSHRLLSADEQVLLRRLAVFNGGCTLDAAEEVVADDALPATAVLDLIDRLVAQSLVILDDQGPTARYRMLETVRQYARSQLDTAGETEALRARHADRYRRVALELGVLLEGRDEHLPLADLFADHDNLRTALDTLAAFGRWREVADACAALTHLWEIAAPAEGLAWLSAALDRNDPSDRALRARLLLAKATIQHGGGNYIEMMSDAQGALQEAEALGDDSTAGRATILLALALNFSGLAANVTVFGEAAERCASAGDRYGELFGRVLQGWASIFLGDGERGWQLHAEAESLVTTIGNHTMTALQRVTGAIGHCVHGDPARAEPEIGATEASLGLIGQAAGVDPELLLRRSVPGAYALFAKAWARWLRDDREELGRLDELIATSRAEGALHAELFLSVAACLPGWRQSPRAVTEHTARVADRARELGAIRTRIVVLWMGAAAHYLEGEYSTAHRLLDEVAAAPPMAIVRYQIARTGALRGALLLADRSLREAEAAAHNALSIAVEYTFRAEALGALELLARIALANHSCTEAARVYGATRRLRDDFHLRFTLFGDIQAERQSLIDILGADAFEVAVAEGYALTLDQAAEYARRARGERKRPALGWDSLTPTELQVVEQVQAGLTNPQIAAALLMSRETVKTHLSHVFTKLGVRTRTELATAAAKHETVGR